MATSPFMTRYVGECCAALGSSCNLTGGCLVVLTAVASGGVDACTDDWGCLWPPRRIAMEAPCTTGTRGSSPRFGSDRHAIGKPPRHWQFGASNASVGTGGHATLGAERRAGRAVEKYVLHGKSKSPCHCQQLLHGLDKLSPAWFSRSCRSLWPVLSAGGPKTIRWSSSRRTSCMK